VVRTLNKFELVLTGAAIRTLAWFNTTCVRGHTHTGETGSAASCWSWSALHVYGFAQVPVYSDLVGYQLFPRYTVSMGVSYAF
jgi:hypothetical protein